MVELYTESTAGVSVASNADINYTNGSSSNCSCCDGLVLPTSTVRVCKPGLYRVSFNGVIGNTGAAAADIGVYLADNGATVAGTETVVSIPAASRANVAFEKIVNVRPSCKAINNCLQLSTKVSGDDAIVYLANLIVERVC